MLKKNIQIKPKPVRLNASVTHSNPDVIGMDLKALGITSPSSQYVTRKIAAKILGVQVQTLALWHCTRRHNIAVYKVGRKAMYLVADLLQFLEASKQ